MSDNHQEDSPDTQHENHSEYLKIIDDLSSELNTLSREVNMVQKDLLNDEITRQFESSLKGLEAQNDLLQTAVENLTAERDTIQRTLQKQNEELKSQICNQEEQIAALQNQICHLELRTCSRCSSTTQFEERWRPPVIVDSSGELRKIEIDLRRKTKIVECLKEENAKLNDELNELRQQQAKAKLLERRIVTRASVGTSAQHIDDEVSTKLNSSQERCREQSKALQKANREILHLTQQIEELRNYEGTLLKERDLLKTELSALKESQASSLGTQKSLQEQLLTTIEELYVAKDQLRECMEAKESLECYHRSEVNSFQELKTHLLDKYNSLVEEFNNVHKEYQKVVQIEQEKSQQIEAFNMWKQEQLKIEKDVRRKMETFEAHIRELLVDKEKLLAQLEEAENDNRTLIQTMDRSRSFSFRGSQSRFSSSPPRGYTLVAPHSSNDPVSKVIANVRSATRKMSQQRTYMDDESSHYFSN